ncbi:MAG: ribonuclease D [Alphaproteobacteria bacterium]|nr:ribonuclease D [Alphaproteobacteria bacterium]MBP9776686.1 ribonuclease D [Alphaproteobacteria bacterium]
MSLITTTPDLIVFCKKAALSSYITVDTEFIRETTYWPQLCLIQVGLEDKAVAIDPLAKDIDLQPFFDLLQNPHVIKVFHSARQDIEIFYHLTGNIPTPLFDTQIAAMVCGFGESIGYDVLVQKYAKVSLDKSSRYTHWAQRPLTAKQLAYALGDVIHLRDIYEKLYAKILAGDRLHWLEDELGILKDPGTYAVDPYAIWQKIKVRSPKPRMLAIFREIVAWREITAQSRNVPRGRVIRDEVMLELAAAAPQSKQEFSRMRGLTSAFIEGEEGKVVLALIAKAQALPLEDCPQVKKEGASPPGAAALVEMLKLLLKIKAEKYHVAPKLLATSADLEVIARSPNPQVPALEGWRREIFGNAALSLKSGKVALGIKNHKITLIPLE